MSDDTDLVQLRALAAWLSKGREVPSSGDVACLLDAIEEIERLRREREVLYHMRDISEARYAATVRVLSGIHALLLPPDFEGADGKTYRFVPPGLRGTVYADAYRELGNRIRAIPEELDRAAKTEALR